MIRYLLLALALICVLSGCLLQQHEPQNPVVRPPADGLVIMELVEGKDLEGNPVGSGIDATFVELKKRADISHVNQKFIRLADAHALSSDKARAIDYECQFRQQETKTSRDARELTLFDAGKITFGHTLESKMVELEKTDKNRYGKTLDKAKYPAGAYRFVGDGKKSVPAFNEELSLPEPLSLVKANGFVVTDGNFQLSKATPLKVQWGAPAIKNENNILLMELKTQTTTHLSALSCIVLEKDFYNGTTAAYEWEIPQTWIAKVPASSLARIDFVRAHIQGFKSDTFKLVFEGLQTVLGFGEVLN